MNKKIEINEYELELMLKALRLYKNSLSEKLDKGGLGYIKFNKIDYDLYLVSSMIKDLVNDGHHPECRGKNCNCLISKKLLAYK